MSLCIVCYLYIQLLFSVFLFFFFKQKTAYEIYQCDWSSDVCSSDLAQSSSSLDDDGAQASKEHPENEVSDDGAPSSRL